MFLAAYLTLVAGACLSCCFVCGKTFNRQTNLEHFISKLSLLHQSIIGLTVDSIVNDGSSVHK